MSGTQRRMARDFKENSPGVNRSDSEPYARHLPNHMPPTEFPRMDGETNDKAARRLLDVWEGCHGD